MRILIVDDDAICRLVLKKSLEDLPDCELLEATDGLNAWERLESGWQPEICFLDVMMPRMDGIQLLAKMRDDPRFAKISAVLCTSKQDRETIINAATLSVLAYLSKPFTPKAVLKALRHHVVRMIVPTWDAPHHICRQLGITEIEYAQGIQGLISEIENALSQARRGLIRCDYSDIAIPFAEFRASAGAWGAKGLLPPLQTLETLMKKTIETRSGFFGQPKKTLDPNATMVKAWHLMYEGPILDALDGFKAEMEMAKQLIEILGKPADPNAPADAAKPQPS